MSCRRNPIFVDQKYVQLIEDSVAFVGIVVSDNFESFACETSTIRKVDFFFTSLVEEHSK